MPDEELDALARRGFTALWLIGVWERSPASRTIKRRMGNPEAEASAYALADYVVAGSLGGEAALADLRDRAWRRGIRLASDMVPNHTGIDSRWVVDHPERFLAWPHADPPYPVVLVLGSGPLQRSARRGLHRGPLLGPHRRGGRLQARGPVHGRGPLPLPRQRRHAHAVERHGAARLPPRATRGTPSTRTILHVARLFPIIRFDAAMTLTRKHFQRLWFPEPGRGGDIPSRAGNGLSRADFDRRMPAEFWREVVDRAAAEAPDTLLLAEAFWLLEGYFVRTLGMHRVYNSAFMNMLKTEDNAGYRLTLRNTLEFDPGVLERFVNFMSNPDEQTAVEQFGSGEKYLGVAAMLATLPGLPMFAHGQVEGFREKYGMEFTRAFWNEEPDRALVERHERYIFPLLRRRHLFARAERFRLYDLFAPEGWVNEDVFAYSNASGARARPGALQQLPARGAQGWIRESAAYAEKTAAGKRLARCTLAEGLGIGSGDGRYVTFREHGSGLEYLRGCREIAERGLAVDLAPYGCQVFLDFAEVADDARGSWSRLCARLAGQPVPSLGRALREMELAPVRGRLPRHAARRAALPGADARDRCVRAVRGGGRGRRPRHDRCRGVLARVRTDACARSRSCGRWKAPRGDTRRPGPARDRRGLGGARTARRRRRGPHRGLAARRPACGASCTTPAAPPPRRTRDRRSSRCCSRIRRRWPTGRRLAACSRRRRPSPRCGSNTFDGVQVVRPRVLRAARRPARRHGRRVGAGRRSRHPRRRRSSRPTGRRWRSPAPSPRPAACATPRRHRPGGGTTSRPRGSRSRAPKPASRSPRGRRSKRRRRAGALDGAGYSRPAIPRVSSGDEEEPMSFAERMKDMIDKGLVASRDFAKKAGEKAKELGEKGVLKLEIAQLESRAEKLVAKLGAEVYASMVDRNVATVSRDTAAISSILKEIEGLRASIEKQGKGVRRDRLNPAARSSSYFAPGFRLLRRGAGRRGFFLGFVTRNAASAESTEATSTVRERPPDGAPPAPGCSRHP